MNRILDKLFPKPYEIWRTSTHQLYMRRRYILPRGEREGKRAWWPISIKLHEITLSDWQSALHHHPWDAVSLIIKGSYDEERFEGNVPGAKVVRKRYFPGHLNFIRHSHYHKLTLNTDKVWSIFITGPKKQEWGFWVDGKNVHHEEYDRN